MAWTNSLKEKKLPEPHPRRNNLISPISSKEI